MSARAAWLAWSTCALSLVLTGLAIGLVVLLNLAHPPVRVYDYWIHSTAIAVAFSTVGAIIASHRPRHWVGWLFCMIGFLVAADHFCGEYAIYALKVHSEALPAGEAAAWIHSWIWIVSGGLGVSLVLLFPDGRLASIRWRYFAWLNAVVAVLGSIAVAFSPGPIDGIPAIPNPLGIDSLGLALGQAIVDLVEGLQMVVALTAAVSPFVRLRHAGFRERQQIKWFAYAATILIIGAILSSPVPAVWEAWWISPVGFILSIVGIVGLPIAVGIAILRYHLYDINLIINRTLVYVPLSTVLAGLFELNVVVLSRLFAEFAAHRHLTRSHDLAELVSALAIAVVFDPLKERIQRFVNRYLPREEESGTRAYSDKDSSTELAR